MDIKDKVVIVTGAASGIGKALAERFAKGGARAVVVADLHWRERKVGGRQPHQAVGQLSVERVAAQTADDQGDLALGHENLRRI